MILSLALALSYTTRAQKHEINPVPPEDGSIIKLVNYPERGYVKPLEEITLKSSQEGNILVRDSKGDIYFRQGIEEQISFSAGGAVGVHSVSLLNEEKQVVDSASFYMNCRTSLEENDGRYSRLLDVLYWTMVKNWGETNIARLDGKFYKYFVSWLRDHVHTLKGMKYFYPDLKSGIDMYSDYQREDGMIWDNLMTRNKEKNWWDKRFQYGDFIMHVDNNRYELKRIPVENDVEYLFIEGLYYTWKATGDDEWMKSHLDEALKAIEYSRTDPYRWSEKYQLLKRGFTIDTWDFQPEMDAERVGGDIMVVDTVQTRFGIMFGDNTGMAASCRYLAEMLSEAGRKEEAQRISAFGRKLKKRIDSLAWTGDYYTHHVPIDPDVNRDFGGTDQSAQVSLSNAYSLNRTLTHEQCVSIIETYKEIRKKMPASSTGEWYTIYPPFNKGFHLDKWEYMNGGVTPIVAGELAHGAFEHGFEDYGVDILHRLFQLSAKTENYLHCTYRGKMPEKPQREFTPVDITRHATSVYPGKEVKMDGKWIWEGARPTRTFHHVPFLIPKPDKSQQTCIQVTQSESAPANVKMPVNKKAQSLYFLHTSNPGNIPGTITLNYSDGSSHTDYIINEKIGNWWVEAGGDQAKKAWRSNNKGHFVAFYLYGMNNPHPDKTIQSVSFQATSERNYYVKALTLSDHAVYFPPDRISYGIPDNWGSAAVVYALVEGLMGVKDLDQAYKKALLAPRWAASKATQADATVKYPASGGYVSYQYEQNSNSTEISFTGNAGKTEVKLLLPNDREVSGCWLNGKKTNGYHVKTIEESEYLILGAEGKAVHTLKVEFGVD
jgi:hypothetical protein